MKIAQQNTISSTTKENKLQLVNSKLDILDKESDVVGIREEKFDKLQVKSVELSEQLEVMDLEPDMNEADVYGHVNNLKTRSKKKTQKKKVWKYKRDSNR